MGSGVGEELFRGLAPWAGSVDLHLMVDRVPEFVRRFRSGRVTVHLRDPGDLALAADTAELGEERWISVEPQRWSADLLRVAIADVRPSGVLMLTVAPATAAQVIDLARVDTPAWDLARSLLPLGADGGVTADAVAPLAAAGAGYFVCGRSLFSRRGTTS